MSRMRVYEYAKKQNVTSKTVIEKLKEMDVAVSNHMSTINRETAAKLDELFNKQTGGKTEQSKKPQDKRQSGSKKSKTTEAKRQDDAVGKRQKKVNL